MLGSNPQTYEKKYRAKNTALKNNAPWKDQENGSDLNCQLGIRGNLGATQCHLPKLVQ
jgi:hypothetical protein